jgi:hypothetical protein
MTLNFALSSLPPIPSIPSRPLSPLRPFLSHAPSQPSQTLRCRQGDILSPAALAFKSPKRNGLMAEALWAATEIELDRAL